MANREIPKRKETIMSDLPERIKVKQVASMVAASFSGADVFVKSVGTLHGYRPPMCQLAVRNAELAEYLREKVALKSAGVYGRLWWFEANGSWEDMKDTLIAFFGERLEFAGEEPPAIELGSPTGEGVVSF